MEVRLSDIDRHRLKPGDRVRIRAEHSLVEEPVHVEIREIVNSVNPVFKAELLTPDGKRTGVLLAVKHGIVSDEPALVAHYLPWNTISVERLSDAGLHIVGLIQLWEEGKKSPETARALAYLAARYFHERIPILDMWGENAGERPFDIYTYEPDEAETKDLMTFMRRLRSLLTTPRDILRDEELLRVFRETFREFVTHPEKMDEAERMWRERVVEILKRAGYTLKKVPKT